MFRLPRSFFNRFVVEVAQDLLGQILVVGSHQGMITETEAYRGADDEASHAFKGRTPRSSIMFGPPGMSYVYLIYGMYHCLNVVTEGEGFPSAVLIRGLKLLTLPYIHINGPGKLCRELQITKIHHGMDLIEEPHFYIKEGNYIKNFSSTPRIGIRMATDKRWRFVADF